jgi:sugar/nucleoside kinase (ribokinase family)
MNKTNDVIGFGNTIMDFIVEVDDHTLLEFNLKKGEMHLVDEQKAKSILNHLEEQKKNIEMVPGGSSANTMRGLSLLGASTIFCGRVGNDPHGDYYIEALQDHRINTKMKKHFGSITGHAIGFITPDAQRTFSVHLGAGIHFAKEDIIEKDIIESKVIHIEGYQLEGNTKDALIHAMQLAKKHNTKISLDLADPGLIRRKKDLLQHIVKTYADIVFVNETEAKEFTGSEEADAAKIIGEHVEISIVKLGKHGSIIYNHGETSFIEPVLANAVDTTGAGDTYAAGFLYGYTHHWPLAKAGKLGSLLAAKVVEQKGVKLKHLDFQKLAKKIEQEK